MFLRFLDLCVSCMLACSLCQALPMENEQKILCKIKNDRENNFQKIPGVIPVTIVRNQTVPVFVDVMDKAEGRIFFKACEFNVPKGKTGTQCQQLVVSYGNKTNPSQKATTTGQHLIDLTLPDHLKNNPYGLQVTFVKGIHNSSDQNKDVGSNGNFIPCGAFAVKRHKTKRQAETCRGFGEYIMLPGIDEWCRVNCAVGYCPGSHCTCDNQAYPDYEDDDDDLQIEFLNP